MLPFVSYIALQNKMSGDIVAAVVW